MPILLVVVLCLSSSLDAFAATVRLASTGKKLARSIVATVLIDGRHFRAVVPVTYDNASGKSAKLKR